jgi:hypothetical protein
MLLDGKADPTARDAAGRTPLHLAAATGNRKIVEMLLGKGADPRTVAPSEGTPAQAAEKAGHADLAERLRKAAAEK